MKFTSPLVSLLVSFLMAMLLGACSVDSARNHYVLAEKLWADKMYSAAVSEFEKVIAKDPQGKLGLQATYRAAMTQFLFLSQYSDAVRKFRSYTQGKADPQSIWEAELQIGEILFSKTEQYDQAILHYQSLLQQKTQAVEGPEFMYRIGKSQFFLFQFSAAIETYHNLMKTFPKTSWAEKASFETGLTYFTRGGQGRDFLDEEQDPYQQSISAYEKFLKSYPQSDRVPDAKFGIASCLEELDRLEEATEAYSSLKNSYHSPQVVEIKLIRIKERMAQRHANR